MELELERVSLIVGSNIALYRKRRGMTQREFGRALSVLLGKEPWSGATVSQAETGKRSFVAAEMVAICHVLNAGIADLFHGARLPDAPQSERAVMSAEARKELRAIREQLENLERAAAD